MRLFKQSAIYFLGRALPALIGVGGIAWYTRLLDPASIGSYALLLSTALFASGMGYSWLRVSALRVQAGVGSAIEPNRAATVLVLFAGTSAVIALCEALGLHFFDRTLQPLRILLATAAAVAAAWYDLNSTMLQARLSVVSWGMLNLARSVVALGISVGLILLGLKTDAMLAGFVLGNCATLIFARMWSPAIRGRFDPQIARTFFAFGWPSSVTMAMSTFSSTFQRYVLAIVAGTSAVGLYSVAQDFASQTMSVLIGSISLAGVPLAFKAKDSGSAAELDRQLRSNARLIFAVALPAAAGVAALATPIATVFFGERFRDGAGVILAMIAVAGMLTNIRIYYFDQTFELMMKTRPQAIISGIAIVVVTVASLVFIPRFGAVGAAMASLSSGIAGLALSIAWGMRTHAMPIPFGSLAKTALAVAGMVAAAELFPHPPGMTGLAILVTGCGLAYLAITALLHFSAVRSRVFRRSAVLNR